MNIDVNCNESVLVQKLNRNMNTLSSLILFDISSDNKSERLLALSENGVYSFSFSRPVFDSFIAIPWQDYEFVFALYPDELGSNTAIKGRMKLKNYMIGAILLAFLNIISGFYNVLYCSFLMNTFFHIVMPCVLCLYFILGYFLFRSRVKKFVEGL